MRFISYKLLYITSISSHLVLCTGVKFSGIISSYPVGLIMSRNDNSKKLSKFPRSDSAVKSQSSDRHEVKLKFNTDSNNVNMWVEYLQHWCGMSKNSFSGTLKARKYPSYAHQIPSLLELDDLDEQEYQDAIKRNMVMEKIYEKKNIEQEITFKHNLDTIHKPELYWKMIESMSAASLSQVQGDLKYDVFSNTQDPIELLAAVERTHVRGGIESSLLKGIDAEGKLRSTKMYSTEYLSTYVSRFRSLVESLTYVDDSRVPDEFELSLIFCKSLDKVQFGKYMERWNEDQAAGNPKWPASVNEAYSYLMAVHPNARPQYKVQGSETDNRKISGSVAFAAADVNNYKTSTSISSKKVCTHCGKNGHLEGTCFKLHPELLKHNNHEKFQTQTSVQIFLYIHFYYFFFY